MDGRRPLPPVIITLDWDTASKRWRLEWRARVGKGWARHWLWVESPSEITASDVRVWADHIRQDLEQRLF